MWGGGPGTKDLPLLSTDLCGRERGTSDTINSNPAAHSLLFATVFLLLFRDPTGSFLFFLHLLLCSHCCVHRPSGSFLHSFPFLVHISEVPHGPVPPRMLPCSYMHLCNSSLLSFPFCNLDFCTPSGNPSCSLVFPIPAVPLIPRGVSSVYPGEGGWGGGEAGGCEVQP